LQAVLQYVYYGKEMILKDKGHRRSIRNISATDTISSWIKTAIPPPWGTLTTIDLNSGRTVWKIPLGEYPELAAKGLTGTGS
jgi:quinoprotein glucose dehydrogenase